jgi:hypothetical protein
MADNISGTTKTDNISGTAKPVHVQVRLDPEVWKRIKIMSIRDGVSISELVNEALGTWNRWLAKAALEEAKAEAREEVDWKDSREEKEYKEAVVVLKRLKVNAHMAMMRAESDRKFKFALRSQRNWNDTYPGKPWPGRKGLGRRRKCLEEAKGVDNISGTGTVNQEMAI